MDYCINDLIGPAVQLLTETSMRAEECIGTAKWGGVDWEQCTLHLEDAKAGPRDVALSRRAIEILKALGPSEDPEEQIFGISYEALQAGWRPRRPRPCMFERGLRPMTMEVSAHLPDALALRPAGDLAVPAGFFFARPRLASS